VIEGNVGCEGAQGAVLAAVERRGVSSSAKILCPQRLKLTMPFLLPQQVPELDGLGDSLSSWEDRAVMYPH